MNKLGNSNFLQTAIQSMSAENFDSLVKIFANSYLHYEAVNVNGTNDGGNDIRIFQNRREVKRCVQVTINKLVERKLKQDLLKVDKLINQYSYADSFDFFCSVRVSEEKMEELKKFALDKYEISLNIYDCNRLAQLDCKPMREFIYSLFGDIETKIIPAPMNKTDKLLYDILAGGKATTEIKDSILQSVIISVIYEKKEVSIDVLKREVNARLGIRIPNIEHSVQLLKTSQRVIRGESMGNTVRLSSVEEECMHAITADSNRIETDFLNSLYDICKQYGVEDKTALLNQLIKLYKSLYQLDIEEYQNQKVKVADEGNDLTGYLSSVIFDKNKVADVIEDLRHLCETNSYLNRITASASFLSLYKSNELDYYISHKSKIVYLDTPAFIYYICASYIEGVMWENPYFKSLQSLMQLQNEHADSIKFCIMKDYLLEVAGELIKGLQCCWIENTNMGRYLGETNNTFFNFYQYLKSSELFEQSDDINSFEDFVENMGFASSKVDIYSFSQRFCEIAEDLDIRVVERQYYPDFPSAKKIYEKALGMAGKYKSPSAIAHDVSQILYLLDVSTSNVEGVDYAYDIYLTSWDSSFVNLKKKLIEQLKMVKYNHFYILNPAKLSNRLALANFNIDASCISSDLFLYADQKYDISNKVKSLLDLIAPILGKKDNINNSLLLKLGLIRKQQLEENSEDMVSNEVYRCLPIEEALNEIMQYASHRQQANLSQKLIIYMNDESNVDSVVDGLNTISQDIQNHKTPNIKKFFEPIEQLMIQINNQENNL